MGLEAVQDRLHAHYGALKASRLAVGLPLYAIEHDQSAEERQRVREELNSALDLHRQPLDRHWLVWVAAAAEVGYGYSGGEYWGPFAKAFPHCSDYSVRERIRGWYRKFISEFGGATPAGAWAKAFPIIALPITHAIVPKFLQRLFIDHLNELSRELAALGSAEPNQLGAVLKSRYRGGFLRFARFLEDTSLSGQLVLALRDEQVDETTPRISAATLRRIVADIEQLPRGSEILQRTRRIFREAAVAPSVGFRDRTYTPSIQGAPRLHGARVYGRRDGEGTWFLHFRVASFERELISDSDINASLSGFQVRPTDVAVGWMPGSALRTFAQGFERVIRAASVSRPLLEAKGANDKLRLMLQIATTPLSTPPWLLRCNGDDAYQIEGLHVRSSQTYLWCTNKETTSDFATVFSAQPLKSHIEGLQFLEFQTPEQFDAEQISALKAVGIGHSLKVRVEPVGLTLRRSAEEDATEWLTSEEPILRLQADFPVTDFILKFAGECVSVASANGPVCVTLGHLSPGTYKLEIGAKSAVPGVVVEPETLHFVVRSPVAWTATTPCRAGLKLYTEPFDATIDEVIGGTATLEVRGPAERAATIEAALFANNGSTVREDRLHRARLPISGEQLHKAILDLAKPDWSDAMESAGRVEIRAIIEGLGQASLSFSHAIEPIRWRFESSARGWVGRLVDEAEFAGGVKAAMFLMSDPTHAIDLDVGQAMAGIVIEGPGALLIARGEGSVCRVIMSPPVTNDRSVQDLLPRCQLRISDNDPKDVRHLSRRYKMWSSATLRGPWADLRRSRVQQTLHNEIAAIAAGRLWAEKWARCAAGDQKELGVLKDIRENIGFGPAVMRSQALWAGNPLSIADEYAALSLRYQVTPDVNDARDAAFLAFDPGLINWASDDAEEEKAARVIANRSLVKGAFLAKALFELARRANGGIA